MVELDNYEVIEYVANLLEISADRITFKEKLGGLTNQNFKISIDDKDYVLRIPGKGTELYLNRKAEKYNSEFTSELGINPKAIYFDAERGVKIVEYIPNAETITALTGKEEENLVKIGELFRTLHHSKGQMMDLFNVFEKITEYENVLEQLNGKLLPGYHEVKEQVFDLKEKYESLSFELSPCHNDPLPENFVRFSDGRMYLIDWEFSGMNDPLWDIAAYIIEAELNKDQEHILLNSYFHGDFSDELLERLLMNKIFLDFLWTLWALIKLAGGEDYEEYALNRFVRAKNHLGLLKGEK